MLLETIRDPKDLKKLDLKQLHLLADEIRERIIDVLASKGGHLASNLGTVELIIAMHWAFNSPKDKFLWDVSHQAYTHKILTGRNDSFETILEHKGLCGFIHPAESPHDHFHLGHAGTCLSQAIGLLKSRELNKSDEYIVGVIGDASLTCGVTLEALNNLSRDMKRFIIILNDNAMSISKNVGAITQILSRLINSPITSRLSQELDAIVSKIPGYGDVLANQGKKLTESVKNLVSPATFFEHFGLSYIGPIDGHNIKELIATFTKIKTSNWPILLHVVTKKGLGLEEAMKNPESHHGAKPFEKTTGKFLPTKSSKPTFPKVFGKHLVKMGKEDPSLVAVTPAMSYGSALDSFMEQFPDRCFDVGIAESHAVTFSGALAHGNRLNVFMVIYATFLQRAFDNLFHDVCLQELPVVFAVDRAGLANYGATHHGIYDIAFLNVMPNMVIAQPRNGQILVELMESAFEWKRPAAIRYPNLPTEDIVEGPIKKRELGKGEVIHNGKDLLIIGLGMMCDTATLVRESLKTWGIDATVLDPIFVKPLDTELLCELLVNHNKIVTLEEHSVQGGMGAILNHFLMAHGYSHIDVLNLGIPETFVGHGSVNVLLDELGLSPEKITSSIVQHFNLNAPTKVTY